MWSVFNINFRNFVDYSPCRGNRALFPHRRWCWRWCMVARWSGRSTSSVVIFPVFMLAESSTIASYVAPGACFVSFPATIPATLWRKRNLMYNIVSKLSLKYYFVCMCKHFLKLLEDIDWIASSRRINLRE